MGTSLISRAAIAVSLLVALSASCADSDPPKTRAPFEQAHTETPTNVSHFERTASGFVTTSAHWSARVTHAGHIELAAQGPGAAMLSLETVGISRDLSALQPAARVAPDSAGIAIARERAVERVERIDTGVEQSWRFDSMPSGTGALEVVVAVAGAAHTGADGRGLRFADATSGVRFRYGFATWIDATGKRTAVPTVATDGMITMTVDETVLSASQFPAVLDPTVEAEIELDSASVYAPASGAQRAAQIAGDGVDALVVWEDERDGPQEIFGTGVSDTGNAYQRANVRLSVAGLFGHRIAHVRTEANGIRHYVMIATNQFDLVLVPIAMSATGDITAGDRDTIFTAPPMSSTGVMDVAASVVDGHYLVLFQTSSETGNDAWVQVFDATDHQPLTSAQQLYDLGGPHGYQSRATFAGTDYIVLSRDSAGDVPLRARSISPNTALVTNNDIIVNTASNASNPSIAYNGQDALAVWVDRRTGESIWGRRIPSTGPLGTEFDISQNASGQFLPTAVAGDTTQNDFFVIWLDERNFEGELWGGTVSSADAVSAVASGTGVDRPHGARVGDGPTAVYNDFTESSDVFSRDFTTTWAAAVLLTEEANRQTSASVAATAGATGLVAWTDSRAGAPDTDIFVIPVDGDGAPTGSPVSVSNNNNNPEGDTDVATGNGESIVVWRRGDDAPPAGANTEIVAALVDADGVELHTVVLTSSGANAFPRVLFDGTSYLVTWQAGNFDCETTCQYIAGEPQLVTLTTSGSTITPSTPTTPGERGLSPTLAQSPDGNVLWVWAHDGDISASRITSSGTVSTPIVVSAEPGNQSRPAVAMDDDVALIAYEDDRDGGSQLFAALLDTTDAVTLLGSISGDIESREAEVVDADDGYSFLVVWDGSAFGAPEQVWAAWVKKSGAKADPIPRRLTNNTAGASRRPDVTPLGSGRMMLSFDAVLAERAERASTMIVDSGQEDGTICDIADQCASRFCADGVCCTEACTGDCRQCNSDGVCLAVTLVEDDSCFGTEKCSENGECLRNDGETCNDGVDCASGHCVDGVCCESECSGECDKCRGAIPGQCRPQACGNFSCHDDKTCRERCTESRHCLDGFQCVDGECVTPPDIRVVDPGCACHLPAAPKPHPWWLLLALLLPLRRRRRR